MITKEMIEQAREIVEKLDLPEEFGVDESGDMDDQAISLLTDRLEYLRIRNFNVMNGISKAVIVLDDYPFVIKIPFNGNWHYEYDYDEHNDEWFTNEEETVFTWFTHACAPDTSDYCWNEYDKIKMAQDRGYGDLFPDMAQIFEDDYGRHFYIQEKVRVFSYFDKKNPPSADSRKRAESMEPKYSACNVNWRASVIDFYGENFWISFVNWNDHGCFGYLDDMHSSNYGYRFDGTPVLIDVSGFRD